MFSYTMKLTVLTVTINLSLVNIGDFKSIDLDFHHQETFGMKDDDEAILSVFDTVQKSELEWKDKEGHQGTIDFTGDKWLKEIDKFANTERLLQGEPINSYDYDDKDISDKDYYDLLMQAYDLEKQINAPKRKKRFVTLEELRDYITKGDDDTSSEQAKLKEVHGYNEENDVWNLVEEQETNDVDQEQDVWDIVRSKLRMQRDNKRRDNTIKGNKEKESKSGKKKGKAKESKIKIGKMKGIKKKSKNNSTIKGKHLKATKINTVSNEATELQEDPITGKKLQKKVEKTKKVETLVKVKKKPVPVTPKCERTMSFCNVYFTVPLMISILLIVCIGFCNICIFEDPCGLCCRICPCFNCKCAKYEQDLNRKYLSGFAIKEEKPVLDITLSEKEEYALRQVGLIT